MGWKRGRGKCLRFMVSIVFGTLVLLGCSNTMEADISPESHESLDSLVSGNEGSKIHVDSLVGVSSQGTINSMVFFPENMRDEGTAYMEMSDSNSCGVSFQFLVTDSYTELEFQVDGVSRFRDDFLTSRTYKEFLPCGLHRYRWKWYRSYKDGKPASQVSHIQTMGKAALPYGGEWTFESGWPTDIQADKWVVNNFNFHQGEYSIWAGYMQDEDVRVLKIPVPAGATKFNFFYEFSNSGSSYTLPYDELSLTSFNDSVNLSTTVYTSWPYDYYYTGRKYSRIINANDTMIVLRMRKSETGYAKLHFDDFRFLFEKVHAQTDSVWDFEDGFYPQELSQGWTIDNENAYEGEYSLRTRWGKFFQPSLNVRTTGFDSLSLWIMCDHQYGYDSMRLVAGADTTRWACSSSWRRYTAQVAGFDSVQLVADNPVEKPAVKRIDFLRLW